MASRVYDHILKARQHNGDKHARLLASRQAGGGRKLQPGDLAYIIERGLARKKSITGLFVIRHNTVSDITQSFACIS